MSFERPRRHSGRVSFATRGDHPGDAGRVKSKQELYSRARDVATKYVRGAEGCEQLDSCLKQLSDIDPECKTWTEPRFRHYVQEAKKKLQMETPRHESSKRGAEISPTDQNLTEGVVDDSELVPAGDAPTAESESTTGPLGGRPKSSTKEASLLAKLAKGQLADSAAKAVHALKLKHVAEPLPRAPPRRGRARARSRSWPWPLQWRELEV